MAGCTAVVALVREGTLYVANAGGRAQHTQNLGGISSQGRVLGIHVKAIMDLFGQRPLGNQQKIGETKSVCSMKG